MALSSSDVKLFYKLWLSVLQFVDTRYCISHVATQKGRPIVTMDEETIYNIASYMFDHREVIDEYVSENPGHFSSDELKIIQKWKYRVNTTFVIDRIVKKGAILIATNTSRVYCVEPILSSWDELTASHDLPASVETALLPFKNQIIFDSILKASSVELNPEMCEWVNAIYLKAKRKREIISSAAELIKSEKVQATPDLKVKLN